MQTCQPWELTKQHKNNLKIKIHGKLAHEKQRSLELHFSTLTNKALWFPCRNLLKQNNFIRICSFRKTFFRRTIVARKKSWPHSNQQWKFSVILIPKEFCAVALEIAVGSLRKPGMELSYHSLIMCEILLNLMPSASVICL